MDLLLKVLCQVRLPFQKALLHSTGFMLIWNWGDWRSDGMRKYTKKGNGIGRPGRVDVMFVT